MGLLRRYVVPVSEALPAARFLARATRRFPRLAGRVERELRKRRISPHVPPEAIAHEAAGWEALYTLAWRAPVRSAIVERLAARRSAIFDARASRHVDSGDDAVFVTQTAGLATLRRSTELGAQAFLDCPIVHYRYAERLLREELGAAPAFAGTMQFHRFTDAYRRRVDAEIAAASRLIVYTDLVAASFEEDGVDRRKIVVSALGVDLELFRPAARADDGVFRVLFVGQVSQRKGLSYLLESFRLADLGRAELMVVGRLVGDAGRHLAQPNVHHLPHVPRWALPAIYETADVFVLPTLIEGMPQTALEAMASGLPVIVSENAFGREILQDGRDCFVVPIRDSEAIAQRLRELQGDPNLRVEMGQAARRRAEAFTWSAFADRIREAIV
jgi:glycosyltransferase involved in cell wall biosynthesis